MSTPNNIRIFFAIDLSDTIKTQIGKMIQHFKKQSKTESIRWTQPQNLHLTLQFIGEVRVQDIENLVTKVREAIKDKSESFSLSYGNIVLFPNPYRPRVIALDVKEQALLTTLANLIAEVIKACSYEVESRPFRGHITLGRIKHPKTKLQFLQENVSVEVETMPVGEIVLFRSDPLEVGSQYTILEKFHLK